MIQETLTWSFQAIADGALGEGSAQKIGRLGFQELLHLFRGTGLPDYGGNDNVADNDNT